MIFSKDEKHGVVHAMYPELNDVQRRHPADGLLVTKTMVGLECGGFCHRLKARDPPCLCTGDTDGPETCPA